MSGKGSTRRPAAVPRATVDANYERTFATPTRTDPRLPAGFVAYEYESIAGEPMRLVGVIRPPSDRTDAQG